MDTSHDAGAHPEQGPARSPTVGGLARDLASLADVIDQLRTGFASHLDLATITATVRRCRRELDIIHGPALPELVERLARQRLHAITGTAAPDRRARQR